ncbi:MAG: hypothetical protein ABII90_08415 [Bacteroidota bacterium]
MIRIRTLIGNIPYIGRYIFPQTTITDINTRFKDYLRRWGYAI